VTALPPGVGGDALRRRLGRRVRAGAWLGALASLAALASTAHAQAGPALHWVRGPGAEVCIPPAELAQALEARFGAPIFASATDAELAVEGYIAATETGYHVLLQVSDREGHVLGSRTLDSPHANCRALDEALILVIVLTLDPEAGLLGSGIALPDEVQARLDDALSRLDHAIENGQVPAQGEPVAAKPAPKPRHARPPGPKPHARWSLGALGGLSFGATPSLSWLAGLRAGFQPPGLPLFELSALMIGPSTDAVERTQPDDPEVDLTGSAEIGAWAAALGLSVCTPRALKPRFRVSLCGGLEAGVTRAWGEGFIHETSQLFPHVALSAAGALEVPLGRRWMLGLELGGLVPFTRPEFVYETALGANRSVFVTSAVIGRTLLSLGLRLD